MASDGTGANLGAYGPIVSEDARFVAFISSASNLVPDDTNGETDVFVHDTQTRVTERVSVSSSGAQGAAFWEYDIDMTADGRFVTFSSQSATLVADDTNNLMDVFVHDRETGTTERVSVDSNGNQVFDDRSTGSSISDDGRYVTFASKSDFLVPGDTHNTGDLFIHDRMSGATELVNVASDGSQANQGGHRASMSADGRYVAFESAATDLVDGDTNAASDIFVRDRETGTTERVSINSAGEEAACRPNVECSIFPEISADGRIVAFASYATNLAASCAGVFSPCINIFVHDRATHTTELVSVDSEENPANKPSSQYYGMSPDGRYIAFRSFASNLSPGANTLGDRVFVRDRLAGRTSHLSVEVGGAPLTFDTNYPTISGDGCSVAFESKSSNLDTGDSNGARDVYLHSRFKTPVFSIMGPDGGALDIGDARMEVPGGALQSDIQVGLQVVCPGTLADVLTARPNCVSVIGSYEVFLGGAVPALPLTLSIDNVSSLTAEDQVLVGRVHETGDPDVPRILEYLGPATVDASDISIAIDSEGTYSFVSSCPGQPWGFASGEFQNPDGTPIAGAIIASSGGRPFSVITDVNGGFRVPAGTAGELVLIVGVAPPTPVPISITSGTSAVATLQSGNAIPIIGPLIDLNVGVVGIKLAPEARGGGMPLEIPLSLQDVIIGITKDELMIKDPTLSPPPCTTPDIPTMLHFGPDYEPPLEVGDVEQLYLGGRPAVGQLEGTFGLSLFPLITKELITFVFVFNYHVSDEAVGQLLYTPEGTQLLAVGPGKAYVSGSVYQFRKRLGVIDCFEFRQIPPLTFEVIAARPKLSTDCPAAASPGQEITYYSHVAAGVSTGFTVTELVDVISSLVVPVASMQLPPPPAPPPVDLSVTVKVRPGLPNGTVIINTAVANIRDQVGNEELLTAKCSTSVRAAHDPNEKRATPSGRVAAGSYIDYVVEYENEGDGTAFDVSIGDQLSAGLVASSLQIGDGGIYDSDTRLLTWDIGTVGPHEGGTVSFSVQVDPDLPTGTAISNGAEVFFPSALEITPTNSVVHMVCGSDDTDCDLVPDIEDNCPSIVNEDQADWDADGIGDACDDSDGDTMADAIEASHPCLDPMFDDSLLDPDADSLKNIEEVSVGTDPCLADSDSDGFNDAIELSIGTDAVEACPVTPGAHDAWPPDFNGDTRVNLADVFLFRSHFATIEGDPDYDPRFDLNADGRINLADVFILRQHFATQCVP